MFGAAGARTPGYITARTWVSFSRWPCLPAGRALSHLRSDRFTCDSKESFLRRHPPCPSPVAAGPKRIPPCLPPSFLVRPHRSFLVISSVFLFTSLPPFSRLSLLSARSPFFPDTSLSTRLTPPLVAYLESSITCT